MVQSKLQMPSCSGDLYGIRDEAEDRAQPEEKGEPSEEAGHELDPFRGFGRRRQRIRPVPLCDRTGVKHASYEAVFKIIRSKTMYM
jgi:hypothetical protein